MARVRAGRRTNQLHLYWEPEIAEDAEDCEEPKDQLVWEQNQSARQPTRDDLEIVLKDLHDCGIERDMIVVLGASRSAS